MTFTLRMTVNDRPVELEVDHDELLLDVLRTRLDLTAAKRSCEIAECGACTVLVDRQPVSSCCTLAWDARGRRVDTAEGLARDGELNPLQEAFAEHGALQCGYCTPGMLMSATAVLEDTPAPTAEEVRHGLRGTLCRCTGYRGIVDAVVAAGAQRAGDAA
jgi:aerobic carbon-monoxide dehydrogenase small subunit